MKQFHHRIDWAREQFPRSKNHMRPHKNLSDQDAQNLVSIFEVLRSLAEDFRMSVERNTVRIYTNDFDLVNKLVLRPELSKPRITCMSPVLDPDAVYLKRSDFQYRTQLRVHSLNNEIRKILLDTVKNSNGECQLCPSLLSYCQKISGFTNQRAHQRKYQNYYWNTRAFMDHSDPKWATLLSLIVPGIVVKTRPIKIKDK